MRLLTLTQPWATLVAIGAKRIETRSWATSYRGPLAIHAAAGLGAHKKYSVFRALCESEPFHSALARAGYTSASHLPSGAIVAVAELFQCVSIPAADERTAVRSGEWHMHIVPPYEDVPEYAFGDYTPGRFAWPLVNVKPLREPLVYRGVLGLPAITDEGVLCEIEARAA